PGCVDNGLQIRHPAVQRHLFGRAIGKATAALVVADERVPFAQPLQPMTPNGALPIELDMSEPVAGLYDRRATAVPGPCQAHSVRGDAEANLLLHTGMLTPSAFPTRGPRRAAAFSSWARSLTAARSSSVES